MSETSPPPQREYVTQIFGAIADRYDLMNRLMTLWQDQRWRRQTIEITGVRAGAEVLDVATGTGDMAFELAKAVQPGGSVIGIDFSEPMLMRARQKDAGKKLPVVFELGDALNLPFEDNRFDAVTCGFGVRNFEDRAQGLQEMVRVLKPGRRAAILELTPPKNAYARRYMDEVIPRLGQWIAGARREYTYLPQSVHEFPDAAEFGHALQAAGLRAVTYRLLNFGTVALHWGTKPEPAEEVLRRSD
ncbi:MAG: bifunctional demethylmenaquinone methyltransferase/2-methoxy-6-polyprenyl-1,4-benzoquinol methylase UbiE [Chloroflexota bacterium]